MALVEPLLTIAIPTYNRSRFLDRCLEYLTIQIDEGDYPVEMIVSDNCSTDNTGEIVQKYISKGFAIRYIKNIVNKGSDFNIVQCYIEAKGKYVLALGDDDLLKLGSIKYLITLLSQKKDYGLIFLNSKGINQEAIKDNIAFNSRGFNIYQNNKVFLEKVTYFITFISANIVNRKYIDKAQASLYLGSNLNQVPIILESLLSPLPNVYVADILLLTEPNNTGGYSLFDTFGPNFYRILTDIEKKHDKFYVRAIVMNKLLIRFFPIWIIHFKEKNHNFTNDIYAKRFGVIFGGYINYWLVLKPIIYLPMNLAKIYFFGVRVFSKVISFKSLLRLNNK